VAIGLGAPVVTPQQRLQLRSQWLTPGVLSRLAITWGCNIADPNNQQLIQFLQTLWLRTEVLYWGTAAVQELEVVYTRLAECEAAAGTFGEGCPVCKEHDSWASDSWGQQQQQQQQLQPEQQQQHDAEANGGKGGLSVGAAEYVPHMMRDTHKRSAEAFRVSGCEQASVSHLSGLPLRIIQDFRNLGIQDQDLLATTYLVTPASYCPVPTV
jgi:hypothetical protein